MNTMLSFLFFLISLNVVHGQSDEICYSLSHGSEVADQMQTELGGVPGIAGLPGIKGQKGEPGETELDGACTCEREEIKKALIRRSCIGGIIWDNTCIYLPYTSGKRVRYRKSVKVCSSSGGELLKITGNQMYDVVYDYLNRTWVGDWVKQKNNNIFWLGNTFQVFNNPKHLITITPESKITLDRWRPHWLSNNQIPSTYVNMVIQIRLRGEGRNKGIFNNPPSYTRIPLCQYQL